ncbi:hypothetical protein CPC08DRAFT_707101 [Agrocybe pediades]|nr:hypothetical protein CPC08DRAFT_707101 [Agrocybe pediades]
MINIPIWFNVALRDEGVRSWIDDRLKEKENIYFVVGYVLLDRTTVQARDEQLTPLSATNEERPAILDRGDNYQSLGSQQAPRSSQSRKSLNATFEGDIIVAVEYQKLKFGSFPGRRKAEHAHVSIKGDSWTMMEYGKDEVGVFFQPEKPRKEWKHWSMKMGKI